MTPSESEYIEVTVKHGRKFLIDREDFAKHCQVAWRTRWNENSQNYYVVRSFLEKMPNGRWRCTSLQLGRVILGLERGDPRRVDHINGDPLDNRRINLRICTHTENMQNQRLPKNNTSGFKGVSAWKGRWMAQIMARGKHRVLGMFSTPEEAHVAYCEAAKALHGEFANFGDEPSSVRAALELGRAAK